MFWVTQSLVFFLLAAGSVAAQTKPQRTDRLGDPLPDGAINRMGTVRGRLPSVVDACAFSPDGKTLLATGGDATIHLFDAATGRPLRQLRNHKGNVTCLSFSPDGKTLASGDAEGAICLWAWPSGDVVRRFQAFKGGVRLLAFAGTSKFLVSGGPEVLVHLWDPATGREVRQYKDHKGVAGALAVSPDGRLVASSSLSHSDPVHLWEASSGRLLHQHKSGIWFVQALAFSPDGKHIVLPVDYRKLGLWDVASGKIVRQFSDEQQGGISALAYSPDGQTVASASANCSLVLWDAATGKIRHQLPGRNTIRHPGGITCLAFSPDGRRLAFGEDHCVRVWDVSTWREVFPLYGHTNQIHRLLFSSDDNTLVTAAEDTADSLQEWDTSTGKKLRTLLHERLIGRNGFQLSPDHTVLTVVDTERDSLLIRTINTTTGKDLRRVELPFKHEGGYHPSVMLLSPNGKIVTNESEAKGVFGDHLLLRDTTSKVVLHNLAHAWDKKFLFSPDSRILASVDERKQIDLYDVATGRVLCTVPLARKIYSATGFAFSPDSRLLAVAYVSTHFDDAVSGQLDVWETVTGLKRLSIATSREPISHLAFSPDSSVLAGAEEGVIRLWNLHSCKMVRQLRGHLGAVEALAFSHDGKRLASGGWDTTALLWDVSETAETPHSSLVDVPRARLEQLWDDLGSRDGGRVHRAIGELVTARSSVPWLREHVKPVHPVDPQRITRLLADLDSDTFARREKATRELEAMGAAVEPALRKALAGKPSLELRRRVEPIVNNLERWPAASAATLREWRTLEVLEKLGTPEAQKLLDKLADGAPDARLTQEAKASLARLEARRDTMP